MTGEAATSSPMAWINQGFGFTLCRNNEPRLRMKKFSVLVCFVALSHCKKNPHASKNELEQLAGVKLDRVVVQKKYQLDESSSLEDIALCESAEKSELIILTPGDKGYTLLRHYSWPNRLVDAKLFFIATGNKRSQILITHGAKEKTLQLFDGKNFMQEFSAKDNETSSVKTSKVEEKPHDELLTLGKTTYRFNGIRWIPYAPDEIFPFLETFEVNGDNSLIEIVNRGQFGTRVIVTIAFTDVSAGDLAQKLKLTKDIPTVRLYRPGFPAHRFGGGNVALPHPLVEIQKDSFGKNGRIKLPLFMKDIKKFTLRAVYSQRGQNLNWPVAAGAGIIKDGQGYFAVEKSE